MNIGDIVALNTHPFCQDCSEILIAGDSENLSPLMVVIEIVFNTKFVYDENTGNEIVSNIHHQYKCIWYSNKTNKFEDEWFSGRLLKVVGISANNIDISKIKLNDVHLALKTLDLESRKLKSSLNSDNSFERKYNSNINALLSFVSPILQYVGSTKYEPKEPIFDSKTNVIRRKVSSLLIKCRYYNQDSAKISEVLLPIESLKAITKTSTIYLQNINNKLINGVFVSLNNDFSDYKKNSLVKPRRLIYKFGIYYVEYKDCLKELVKESDISLLIDELPLWHKSNKFNMYAQNGSFQKESITIIWLANQLLGSFTTDYLNNNNISAIHNVDLATGLTHDFCSNNGVMFYIKYKNRFGDITSRFVLFHSIFPVPASTAVQGSSGVINVYMRAYCYLRGDMRNFKTENILEIIAYVRSGTVKLS